MGIMDKFSNLFKDEEIVEEEYDDEEVENEEYEETSASNNASANVNNTINSAPKANPAARATNSVSTGAALEMKVVKPERVDEVYSIADHLLAKRTVVLNLEDTNKETTKRIIDFLSGVVYAIKGNVNKVANATYVVTPKNIDVSGDQQEENNQDSASSKNRDFVH